MTEINIAIVGKTGYGKSSTGNTVLGRDVFEPSSYMQVGSRLPTFHTGEFKNYKLKVYDLPGACDARYIDNIRKSAKACLNHVIEVMKASEGINTFLFVLSYSNKWTSEDNRTVELMRKIFGNTFFSEHCIIVVTHWDNAIKDGVESFDEWLRVQHQQFRELVAECRNGCVVLDNSPSHDEDRQKYRETLLRHVTPMLNQNSRYTQEHFYRNAWEHTKLIFLGKFCTVQ